MNTTNLRVLQMKMMRGGDLIEYYVGLAHLKGGVYQVISEVIMDMTSTWSENLQWAEHMAFQVCYECPGDAEAFEELVTLLGEVLEVGVR